METNRPANDNEDPHAKVARLRAQIAEKLKERAARMVVQAESAAKTEKIAELLRARLTTTKMQREGRGAVMHWMDADEKQR